MIFLGIFRIIWNFLRFLRILLFLGIFTDFFDISADLYGIWDFAKCTVRKFFELFTLRSSPLGLHADYQEYCSPDCSLIWAQQC